MDDDETELVLISAQMSQQLRDDAKQNAERGDLSAAVRDVYRLIAYGHDAEFEYLDGGTARELAPELTGDKYDTTDRD